MTKTQEIAERLKAGTTALDLIKDGWSHLPSLNAEDRLLAVEDANAKIKWCRATSQYVIKLSEDYNSKFQLLHYVMCSPDSTKPSAAICPPPQLISLPKQIREAIYNVRTYNIPILQIHKVYFDMAKRLNILEFPDRILFTAMGKEILDT